MPILIFLLVGVFEVGSALRSYLVLVNVNREITRFAVRPGYLDFSTQGTIQDSYNRVLEWANTSNTSQLDLDFNDDGNTTLIISHVVADTGLPCE
ncbi:MAG: pilus assembly protein, partial [Anaerolineae bacterium]|nr:pilus assembly protein [Anaerolineae bacterium]